MKKKLLLLLVLLLAGGGAYWRWIHQKKQAPSFQKIQVIRDDMTLSITSTGVVAPQNRVEIKAPIAGRIEEILVQEGNYVKKGQVVAWMSSTERSALLDQARIQGPKTLSHWEDLYKPTPLIAPISGTVISRKIEPGQTIGVSDPILVVSDRLLVQAQVDETDIGKLSLNQNAVIELDAYPDKTISARISHIAYEAETVSNVTIYEVEVSPKQAAPFLKSGMTANVDFILAFKPDVLQIPLQAIKERRGKKKVITGLLPSGKPIFTEVETGLSDGKNVEILSGLEEDDTVYIMQVPFGKKKKAGSSPFMPNRNNKRS